MKTRKVCLNYDRLTGIRKPCDAGKQKLEVLKNIDLHIEAGELVSIKVSSGSGNL